MVYSTDTFLFCFVSHIFIFVVNTKKLFYIQLFFTKEQMRRKKKKKEAKILSKKYERQKYINTEKHYFMKELKKNKSEIQIKT